MKNLLITIALLSASAAHADQSTDIFGALLGAAAAGVEYGQETYRRDSQRSQFQPFDAPGLFSSPRRTAPERRTVRCTSTTYGGPTTYTTCR